MSKVIVLTACAAAVSLMLVAMLATALPVAAQPAPKMATIGYLSARTAEQEKPWIAAFEEGLRALGYVEGKNIRTRYRWANRKRDRLPVIAADLVAENVDIFVAGGGSPTRALQRLTKTIPIVMAEATAPVARGLVDSLARPGGNTTGLTFLPPELFGKQLELLREIVPNLARVAVLWRATGGASEFAWQSLQNPAHALGIRLYSMEVRGAGDLETVLQAALNARTQAIYVTLGSRLPNKLRADLSARSGLPTIYDSGRFVRAGGLMAYGTNMAALYRRAASFVDKILKGAKPADLPVEQPTKFDLFVNLKTAKSLGITFPPSILLRATEVIE